MRAPCRRKPRGLPRETWASPRNRQSRGTGATASRRACAPLLLYQVEAVSSGPPHPSEGLCADQPQEVLGARGPGRRRSGTQEVRGAGDPGRRRSGTHEERGAGGPGRTRSGAQTERSEGSPAALSRAVPRLFRGQSRGPSLPGAFPPIPDFLRPPHSTLCSCVFCRAGALHPPCKSQHPIPASTVPPIS